ncbi:glycosyltransferase family 4 protein [Clostridium pasteurianum]|uniref:glycosyltransferase family 4 protein n=1 Tax=Clostridium pasteurianum TaxID=1501 RepID=UPI00226093AF|nr:glycosyltransferase family 4 protein [Clostridium pasteurianum]UZW14943.1 glycosyltransferase family 4 protein [Clostridium pasteurianum]
MKIAIVTNIRAPYRKLQLEKLAENEKHNISIYYTDEGYDGRNWEIEPIKNAKEIYLKKIFTISKYGNLNWGLVKIVKDNDVIVIGGYEKPTYIVLSILCRIFGKKLCLLFDGISKDRIYSRENSIKDDIKKISIKFANAFYANGKVSRNYFEKRFGIDPDRIFNQYLSIDNAAISTIDDNVKEDLKTKYDIPDNKRIILYSGRLIKRKRIDLIIDAMAELDNHEDYLLLIIGSGEDQSDIEKSAVDKNIKLMIIPFIKEQLELFKLYRVGDLLILPSDSEPWGLVVNEALASGLPVICSDTCGCASDLILEGVNGFTFKAGDYKELSKKIWLTYDNYQQLKSKTKDIMSNWNYDKSYEEFYKMIEFIR